MSHPSTLFAVANTAVLPAWLLLLATVFVPSIRAIGWGITGLAVPGALALLYAGSMAAALRGEGGGFGSLAEVRALFADDRALLAGWVHYLAFDLVVGTAVVREGLRRGVPRAVLAVAVPLTFLFGPVGFLVYLAGTATARRAA